MRRIKGWAVRRCALISCVGLLVACGGGGGSDRSAEGANGDTAEPAPAVRTPFAMSAGPDQDVLEGSLVTLPANGSRPGSMTTAQWLQLSGPAVTLSTLDHHPEFVAPSTTVPVDLMFELTVTDGTGSTARDTVKITVHPSEPPTLIIGFPCDKCRFTGEVLTLTGTVDPISYPQPPASGTAVASLTVDAGAGEVAATVTGRHWIAQNVPVDGRSGTTSALVTARDALGRQSQRSVSLQQATTITGGLIATAADPLQRDLVFLMETSNGLGRLLEVNIATGRIRVLWSASELGPDIGQVSAIAIDGARNRLLVLDRGSRALHTLDLSDGQRALLSGDRAGTGPGFAGPAAMAIDPLADRLVVADNELHALIGVDLESGNRSIVSSNAENTPTDMPIFRVVDIALNAATNTAFLLQGPDDDAGILAQFLVEVDLISGRRTPLAQPMHHLNSLDTDAARGRLVFWSTDEDTVIKLDSVAPEGAVLSDGSIHGVVAGYAHEARVDSANNQYVINDFSEHFGANDTNTLIAVDPDTGARSTLFQDALGSGPRIRSSINLDLDATTKTLYLLDAESQSLLALDLSTGDRTVISGALRGSGPAFSRIRDLAIDPDRRSIYVLGQGASTGVLLSIDLDTGNRAILSGVTIGAGPDLIEPTAMVLAAGGAHLFVADAAIGAVLSVDLASGERTVVSGSSDLGDPLLAPTGLVVDAAANRLIVTDEGDGGTQGVRLFAVDLDTGTRSILASASVGSGPPLHDAQDVALLPGGAAVVAALDRLMLVDLGSGNRSIIASNDSGGGENVHNIAKIALDLDKRVVYGWSIDFEALFQFDLVTGDRVVVTK